MDFAPDGRLFVCQQSGQLRVIKNGALLATPFLQVTVDSSGERGLLGVTFDPNFASNQRVYIYYTVPGTVAHNRISSFVANGDVAVTGSETVLLDLNNLSSANNHNGGAIHFGLDGNLYAGVGENANSANAQTLSNLLGKILRLNADGSIPTNNPFYNSATGVNRAIWALGLRSNYGWPNCEGVCNPPNPSFRDPIFQYSHAEGCAITGGTFYNPVNAQFPQEYIGHYFFSDLCGGWIRVLDPANPSQAITFASGLINPVDLKVDADGSLYYLDRGASSVYRVQFTGSANTVTLTLLTQPAGLQLTFDGVLVDTPYAVESVVGTARTLGAPSPQHLSKSNYKFSSWSDGGAQTHVITTPGVSTSYTALFQKKGR